MSGRPGNVNWEEGEKIFITQTGPRVGLREFASSTGSMAWANNTEIPYHTLRDVAKENGWLNKRAKYLSEKYGTLGDDAQIAYGLVRSMLFDDRDAIPIQEQRYWFSLLIDLQKQMMDLDPTTDDVDASDYVGKDDVMQIFEEMEADPSEEELIQTAISALEEKHGAGETEKAVA